MLTMRLLLALLFCLFVTGVTSQSIILGTPSAQTYVDTMAVSISITDEHIPVDIWLTFEYTAGFMGTIGHVYKLTMPNLVTGLQSGSFQPANPLASGFFVNFSTTANVQYPPGSSMPDGTYTVTALYKRPDNIGGATVSSAGRTGIRSDTMTLPVWIMLPYDGETVLESFPIFINLRETAASGTGKLSVANDTHTQIISLSQTTFYNLTVTNFTIDLNDAKVVSSAGEPIHFVNHQYYNFTFSYADLSGVHAPATRTSIVYTDYTLPIVTIASPTSFAVFQWAFYHHMNLTIAVNKPLTNIFVSFNDSESGELMLSLRMNQGITSAPNFPKIFSSDYTYLTTFTLEDGSVDEILPIGNYTVSAYGIDSLGRISPTSYSYNVTLLAGENVSIVERIVYQNVSVYEFIDNKNDFNFSTLHFSLILAGTSIGSLLLALVLLYVYRYYKDNKSSSSYASVH
jgi:hypothetical protein